MPKLNARQFLHPQEVEAFYLIPAIRRELALSMKEEGRQSKDIAVALGITEAAVSQYLHGKRACDVDLGNEAKTAIREASARITNPLSMIRETRLLLQAFAKSKVLCRLHEKMGSVPKGCEVCL